MSQTTRVLLIANNFPPVRGGSAVVYASLARCAAGRITVLAPRIGYVDGLPAIGWREHDRLAPYRVVRLPLLRTTIGTAPIEGFAKIWFRFWDAAIRLRLVYEVGALILRYGIRAICIGELLASSWIIRLFRFIPGVRTIVYVHGEEITTEDPYDPGHHRAREALLRSDAIVVVSQFTLHAVQTLLGPDAPPRITLIRNGVDTERFQPRPKADDLRALYQLEGCFVFVSVCRLLEKKGIDNAIRAFARLLRDYPECRFLVVGTGPYQDTLQALARSEGVAGEVIFAGQVADEELADHYRLGDVFIMPNRELDNGDTEGFGLVFLEANACGLPVIAGRDGGSTDAVREGVNGLLVNGRSVDEIATAMRRLREDPALRDTLRGHALQVATEAGWAEKTRAFMAICLEEPTGCDQD